MYSVYAGSTCIYDDTSNDKSLRLIAPTLELADSAAGSFKMTVPVTNAGYNLIERLKTYITVKKDGEEMWEGRVIDESIDFWKNRTLTCEGELAYLNDSTQPPAEYHDLTVRGFLETLIQIHNSKVSEERRFTVGAVTVTDPNDSLYRYTNYEKTIECINDKLVSRLGGHLIVRKENGVRYLDYLADKLSTSTQIIEFGTNLLDYTASFDMTEYATVLVPLGERLEESPISALEAYTTVASVNDGSIYVQNEEAVASYGWIEKVVHFDSVKQPANLLRKAQQYLSDLQFDNMILEVKAVDLHYMNPEIEGVKLSDQIRVISQPHGLNKVFPVMKLSIPLDQPENTLFTLGTKIQTSLTAENNKVNSEIKQRIEAMPTKQSVLDEARDNATEIMDLISNGYITITHGPNGSEKLYISDTQDLTQATRWWLWNVNGLAYYNTNMGGASPVLAMTMDGSIVADRITTGTLRADLLDAVRIKASTFILENESDPTEPGETLESRFQRFDLSDQQLSSQIGGLTQVAVKKVEVYYALGDSQTQAPGDSANWSTTAPAWESGKYMWQKTLTIFADDVVDQQGQHSHATWSAATCIQGAKGDEGDTGVGITSVVPEYCLHTSSTQAPTTGWTTTCPAWVSGKYIWTRSHVYYDNNTDSTTTPVLDNAVNGLGQSYTEIKQDMQSISLTATSGSVEVGTLSSESYASGVYRFSKTSDGYYTSSNTGIDNSVCYGKLTFNFSVATGITLECISNGESNYDFGIISKVDQTLAQTSSEDTSTDVVFHSFKGEASANPQYLAMDIPSGSHFITFKYKKDSSTSSGTDMFKMKTYTGPGEKSSRITLSGNGINASSVDIHLDGMVTFSDLAGTGTTVINGANIETGTISADAIDVSNLHIDTVYIDYDNMEYPILSSSISTTGGGDTIMTIDVGWNENVSRFDETAINIYANTIDMSEPVQKQHGVTVMPSTRGSVVRPYPNGDWYLGDEYYAWNRLYLGSRAYLYYDSSANALVMNINGEDEWVKIFE